jgi:hypothetical protein
MTCTNTTPEIRTGSTPATTDYFRYRYGKTELAVLSDRRLTANDRIVYATIKAHRNHKSGTAWPSRQRIGEIAGCTDRAVSLATSRLVQAGYLTKQQRTGQSTVYGFPLSPTPERAFTPTPERTFTHKKQFSEQKNKPQLQRQAAGRDVPAVGGVVVVDSVYAKEDLALRTASIEAEAPASSLTASIEAEAPASSLTASIEAEAPASSLTASIEAEAPASSLTASIEAEAPASSLTASIEAEAPASSLTASIEAEAPASSLTASIEAEAPQKKTPSLSRYSSH